MPQPKLEKHFQARVLKDLKTLKNIWFIKVADRVKKGIPDILMCLDGMFVALELKRSDKEKATPLQAYTLDQIKAAGGCSRVASPENWADIFGDLKRMNKN